MRTLIAIILLTVLTMPVSARSESTQKGQALCYPIEKTANALVDYKQTSCVPSVGQRPGTYSFILLSSQPVFSVEASKKGWVLVAVAATGDALNKASAVKAEDLWLSDANLMKSRTSHVMPAHSRNRLDEGGKGVVQVPVGRN